MKSTIKELFTNEFNLDTETMEINTPYNVEEAKIGIKSFDEERGEIIISLITKAIKKEIQNTVQIKLKDRTEWELPVAKKHMYGIYKHNDNTVDYTYAEDLIKGVKVLTENGYSEVEDIRNSKESYVYDIETDASNYYTNGILSHNSLMSHLPSVTGGTALKFFASTRSRVTKLDQLKNGTEDAGIQVRVRNYKNKTGTPWRDAVMNLYFDRGFDSDAEYFDFLVLYGFMEKGNGGVYSAPFFTAENGVPTGKIRGADNAKQWLMEHRDIYEDLKVKVNQKLLTKNELDTDVDPEKEDIAEVAKTSNISTEKLAEEALAAQEAEKALEKEVSEDEVPPLDL